MDEFQGSKLFLKPSARFIMERGPVQKDNEGEDVDAAVRI